MTNNRTVLTVVLLLGLIGVLLTGALAAVVITGHDVPGEVMTLLSAQLGAVVGALGALLAHTGSNAPDNASAGTQDDPVHLAIDPPSS